MFNTDFFCKDDKDGKQDKQHGKNKDKEDEEQTSTVNKINDFFKLPIYYNEKKTELKQNLITDLELTKTVDPSSNPIYSFYFDTNNDVSSKLTEQVANFYTTDISFLKDNQKLIKSYNAPINKYTNYSPNYKSIINIWNELKIDSGFKEKYYYLDWEMIEFLNTSEIFLQFMSIYNLCSPIFSLFVPVIILIIPFFILKMKNIEITVSDYVNVLKVVAQTNAIGKLFTVNFSEIETQEKLYILISAGFYLFSIYQNVMVCVRFNNNMKTIHNHFREIEVYLDNTLQSMNNYLKYANHLTSHKGFNDQLIKKREILDKINSKIKTISEYSIYNISKLKEIGRVLKYFYELHTDTTYEDAIMYSIGFNGYIDCIEGLQKNLLERKINYASLMNDSNKKVVFKNGYYASLKNDNPIKNTIKLKKNLIITGPNASGKTTILKSTLINIIFTQQFGCGFYQSANFKPFDYIHCYLNIPDTSGRDSLFQAEARRCKEILDIIQENKKATHFCVFDELYSGTNPEEAELSATSFMLYLQKYKNVTSLLTTHFIKVCKKLDKETSIQNYKMVTEKQNHKIIFMYKLDKGISEVKGGINVLTELNYPKEIIDNSIRQE
jgi:hypothetical protein